MTSKGKTAEARGAQRRNGFAVIARSVKVDGMLGPITSRPKLAPVPEIAGRLARRENPSHLIEGQLRERIARIDVDGGRILSRRTGVPSASDADIERAIAGKSLEWLDLGLPSVVGDRRKKGDSRLNAVDSD